MKEFEFVRANSLQETLDLLNKYGDKAEIIAGGTDLMIDLREENLEGIEYIIDISGLDELKYIEEDNGKLRLGALTLHAEAAENELIKDRVSLLAKACSEVGSPQIRNRGTLGGNIVTASPCADSVPPLVALDAVLVLKSSEGPREIPVAELIEGPYSSAIESDELITEIKFDLPTEGTESEFIKLARRNAVAKSRLNVACLAQQDNQGMVEKLSLVPGSVVPSPQRFSEVEDMLIGEVPDEALLEKAGEMVAEEMINQSGYRWSTDYKKPVITSLTSRVLNSVLEVK